MTAVLAERDALATKVPPASRLLWGARLGAFVPGAHGTSPQKSETLAGEATRRGDRKHPMKNILSSESNPSTVFPKRCIPTLVKQLEDEIKNLREDIPSSDAENLNQICARNTRNIPSTNRNFAGQATRRGNREPSQGDFGVGGQTRGLCQGGRRPHPRT